MTESLPIAGLDFQRAQCKGQVWGRNKWVPIMGSAEQHSYGTPVLKRLGFEALAGLQKIGRGGLMELLLANKSIQSMVQNILHA